MKGGEAYELAGPRPDPRLGDRRPARIEIYQAGRLGVHVRCATSDGDEWWTVVPLHDGWTPDRWRLAGLARPVGRLADGQEVWRVPGPPWDRNLVWAGPGAPLMLHGDHHPGWLGPEIGPASGPCRTLAEAQSAADAWWLAEVAGFVARGTPGGQPSLFEDTLGGAA